MMSDSALADDALAFFDEIFALVPEAYRPTPKAEPADKKKK